MTNPIAIELKSIKTNQSLSRGTFNYSGKLFVDGVHVADVGNDGNGGADRYLGPGKGLDYRQGSAAYDEAARRVKAEHPQVDLADEGEAANMVEDSLEYMCSRIVENHLLRQDVSKALRRSVEFFEDGLPSDGAKAPIKAYRIDGPKGHTPDRLFAHIRAKHPNAYILNEKTVDEGVEAYRRAE